MKQYDCYIASGWFNPQQAEDLENIKNTLDKLKVNYFSPKDEVLCGPTATIEEQDEAFKANVETIDSCNFVIVNTRDKDLGTIFEAGYSYATKVPIVYYCEGLKGNFNLMLSRSSAAVATSVDELEIHIKEMMKNNNYYSEYKGYIE